MKEGGLSISKSTIKHYGKNTAIVNVFFYCQFFLFLNCPIDCSSQFYLVLYT
jgi:hypothetical protein